MVIFNCQVSPEYLGKVLGLPDSAKVVSVQNCHTSNCFQLRVAVEGDFEVPNDITVEAFGDLVRSKSGL